jgi:hypothetical protein
MAFDEPARRYPVLPWVFGCYSAMAAAVIVTIWFDLGRLGTLMVILLAIAPIIPLMLATERAASAAGHLSPAVRRYNRRMIASAFIYTLLVFLSVYIYKDWHPQGALLWLMGLLPSVGVLAMIAAEVRLLVEEDDEYLRLRFAQTALLGTAVVLVAATVWGFLEQFGLVPHVPAWAAVPIFVATQGLARCSKWVRS